ncbi:MAG: adenylate/guanylate cyclase domain-containing protein [Actinomycetota bacterium]
MRSDLPTGTVTFLFTDVEGSTKLLHELGAERYAAALAEHRRLIREVCARHDGVEVDTQGDAFFVAFPTAPGALAAARETTGALAGGSIHVRIGLHTGTPLLTDEGYVGGDVHRAARIAAAGHGGQVLVSASTARLVDIELRDLGEHRLKDLSAPERIYQLGGGDFPALKSLYRTNLPIPTTSFLGRDYELAEVISLLARNDVRLLTLTGPGGTGKTRLALQAAAEASDHYPNGVWWVPLAPLRDPELVLETAALVVGSKNGLAEHVADKRMLLLFDNFEQVVKAAADLADLFALCPNLDILVTSRERLRVRGEQTYPVPPLAETDGAALFTARARAVDPAFTEGKAVRELCVRLDELPLALELAAARTALFSPEQLLDRLSQRLDLLKGGRDADPRQQTLRATIEWSYDLLTEEEQKLFGRLAVFAGSCSYEAAEEVVGADPDTLQSLLDKSLVRKRESELGTRYWMLETIREYAAERLEATGEAEDLRRRHAEWFLALVEEAYPNLRGNPKAWLDRLEVENDNIRAALDRLEASGQTQLALQMAGAFHRYWYLRGHQVEGWRVLDRLLRADERPTVARARALNGAAVVTSAGDLTPARLQVEEALTLNRSLGDAWGAAYAVFMLGYIATEESEWARAQPLYEESLRAFRDLGDEHYIMLATDGLAWIHFELGDPERSRALHEEVLHRARTQSDKSIVAVQLFQLGTLAFEDGRIPDAYEMLKEALSINRDDGIPLGIAENLCTFAMFLVAEGRAETAARLLSRAEALSDEIGGVSSWAGRMNEKTLASIQAQLDEASFAEAYEQGRALTINEAVALALDS